MGNKYTDALIQSFQAIASSTTNKSRASITEPATIIELVDKETKCYRLDYYGNKHIYAYPSSGVSMSGVTADIQVENGIMSFVTVPIESTQTFYEVGDRVNVLFPDKTNLKSGIILNKIGKEDY